jgi:protein-L-isoaspartate(D-aspartate) O-methyltransferase
VATGPHRDVVEEEQRTRLARFILGLRTRGIQDTRVLAAMERVPREHFVPPQIAAHAYEDRALPIDCGQTVSQPFVVARMTEELAVDDRMKVLEIGTGSGFQTAVLAHLARQVYSIERYRTLAHAAEERLQRLGLSNVTVMAGDGTVGWPLQAPFDRIIVTAATETVPSVLAEQLCIGGRMIVPVGTAGSVQRLMRVDRREDDYDVLPLDEVRFVPLVPGKARFL